MCLIPGSDVRDRINNNPQINLGNPKSNLYLHIIIQKKTNLGGESLPGAEEVRRNGETDSKVFIVVLE